MKNRVKLRGLAGAGAEFIRTRKVSVITQLFTGVAVDTPVKTGHLKANYNVSVDTPNTTVATTTADPVDRIKRDVESMVTAENQSVYLSNGVPYGSVIEYFGGSPQKAPQGMVRINILKTLASLRAGRKS